MKCIKWTEFVSTLLKARYDSQLYRGVELHTSVIIMVNVTCKHINNSKFNAHWSHINCKFQLPYSYMSGKALYK